jgi:MHS family alpha-ketoglutarate permease-like MFS transporter
MCIGSLLIAVTPSYESIGVFAPLLLVIARLIQGLSVGGEYGASATYLSEMAEKDRRGFFSSFQYVTLIAGQLTALCVLLILQMILTEEQLHDWGWRVPFFIGALLAIVVFRIRRGLLKLNPLKTLKKQISRNQECLLYLNIILKRPSLYYS